MSHVQNFPLQWRPLVALVINVFAKEDVRTRSIKSYKSAFGRGLDDA